MMKRILALALLLALIAPTANAELAITKVTATGVAAQSATINASTVLIINDSTSYSVYVRVFWEGETAAAATTSSVEIKKGEGMTFNKSFNITSVSLICASGETAAVRMIYW